MIETSYKLSYGMNVNALTFKVTIDGLKFKYLTKLAKSSSFMGEEKASLSGANLIIRFSIR